MDIYYKNCKKHTEYHTKMQKQNQNALNVWLIECFLIK